ncbi:sensor histidine kinase [Cognatilysobacter lacus]|nr:histidine kinase [Lysobacter lacus]
MERSSARRFWIANALVWTLYVGVSIGLGGAFGGASSGLVLISAALGFFLWIGSGVLRMLAIRRGWFGLGGRALTLRLVAGIAIVGAITQAGIAAILVPALRLRWVALPGGGTPYGWGPVTGYWINTCVVLGVWTAAWVGRRALRRARDSEIIALRAESERGRLELEALRARLNPHFVFNALNNVRALILEDPDRARELVTRLSATLRHALEHSQREWTTLREELAVVDDYLAVEAVHYEQRLRTHMDVDPAVLDARLPPMALQLLVENAIKHGIARTAGGGLLSVRAGRAGDALTIDVVNPGRLDASTSGTGVGLAFLRNRLRDCGGRFSLEERGDGVHAHLEIPR